MVREAWTMGLGVMDVGGTGRWSGRLGRMVERIRPKYISIAEGFAMGVNAK